MLNGKFRSLKSLTTVLFSGVMLLAQTSCDKEDRFSQQPFGAGKPSHLSVFGFYTYKAQDSDIIEQASYSNMVDITLENFGAAAVTATVNQLKLAQSKGLKAKLNIYPIMFRLKDPTPTERAVFESVMNQLKPYAGVIGAFYVRDEPHWNAWMAYGNPWTISDATKLEAARSIKTSLERMGGALRAFFPHVPNVLVEAWPVVKADILGTVPWEIPDGYDWIGMDCYDGTWNDCNGIPIKRYLDQIRSKLKPGQRMILIPPGHLQYKEGDRHTPTESEIQASISLIDAYRNYAIAEPTVIGMWPWYYTDGANPIVEGGGVQYRGYKALPPQLQAKWREIGKMISGK